METLIVASPSEKLRLSATDRKTALRAASATLNLQALELASLVDDRLAKILAPGDDGDEAPAPPPHAVALLTLAATLVASCLYGVLSRFLYRVEGRGGFLQYTLDAVKSLPYVRGLLKKEMDSMERKLRSSLPPRPPSLPFRSALPERGTPAEEVLEALVAAAARDGDGDGKLSGALYLPKEERDGEEGGYVVVRKGDGDGRASSRRRARGGGGAVAAPPPRPSLSHSRLLNAAYAAFSHTNPMHSSVFPAAVCLERDVVSMTASLLGGSTRAKGDRGDSGDDGSRVRGQVTSGGSESILLAVLAAREYSFKTGRCQRYGDERGRPEVVLAASAHAAFFKAAHYFGMRVRVVAPSSTSSSGGSRLTAKDVERHLTGNTALVVASAPSFPHGTIDDVAGVAALASSRGVPCHVDCCLGGFVLAFSREATELTSPSGEEKNDDDGGFRALQRRRRRDLRARGSRSAFDLSVEGVTSISIDVHKFGLSHKGTSVLLFRGSGSVDGSELRRSCFTATTDWPGGLYVSPGVAGSRSGALLGAAWASLVHQGAEGFARNAAAVFEQVDEFVLGIERAAGDAGDPLSELEVVRSSDGDGGFPLGPVVAFRARPSRSPCPSRLPPLNVFAVNDVLSEERGWHLNALQFPAALHVCFTAQHAGGGARRLLDDLRWAVSEVRDRQRRRIESSNGKEKVEKDGGMAPVYGMASASIDRKLVAESLLTYQDVVLDGDRL